MSIPSSILDGIVRDGLLDTVMLQDVYLANRADAASSPGSGTIFNPYSAGGTATDADPPFDQIMRKLAAEYAPKRQPVTVRLFPGTYYTRGFNLGYSGIGWQPWNGLRLVGSSLDMATIKLCNSLAAGHTTAIGSNLNSVTAQFVSCLEISDLTVDANWANTVGNAYSGIGVFGRNIFMTRVRVRNFGNNMTGSYNMPAYGISIARAKAAPYRAEHCVLDGCRVESAQATNSYDGCYGIHLSSEQSGIYHHFSIVRNCLVDMGQSSLASNFVALGAGGGWATIIENNRLANCQYGMKFPNSNPSIDLVFRHNYFRNLKYGSYLSGECKRAIFLNNLVDWPLAAAETSPSGFVFANGPINEIIARGNLMRRMDGEAPNGSETGIKIEGSALAKNVIVDQNIIDAGTLNNAINRSELATGGTMTAFNNQKPNGTFLPSYDSFTQTHDQELITDIEADTLALLKNRL